MQYTYSLSTIQETANQLLPFVRTYACIAFNAPMGSGKTTLIHNICDILGVQDAVSSPTFSIINEYRTDANKTIFHMDWYRLKNIDDAIEAGVQDVLDHTDAWVFIEWPEIAEKLLPAHTLWIDIQIISANERRLTIREPNL